MNPWWYDRPSPSDRGAIDKVFEMAREMTGILDAGDRDDWLMWLTKVAEYLKSRARVGDCERCALTGVLVRPVVVNYVDMESGQQAVSQVLCATCSGAAVRSERRCGLCGIAGHNRITCALNVEHMEVEGDERSEFMRLKAKYEPNQETP